MKEQTMEKQIIEEQPIVEIKLSDWQIRNLAIPIVHKLDEIKKYYENPENEKRFRERYFKRYGVPYTGD